MFNPVPKNKAIDKIIIEEWIQDSVKKANENLIEGKELTPYLLTEIARLSKNKTLEANMDLIINNAKVAGQIATNYYKI